MLCCALDSQEDMYNINMVKFWRPIFHPETAATDHWGAGGVGAGGEELAAGTLTERKTLLCFAGILCGGGGGGGVSREIYIL